VSGGSYEVRLEDTGTGPIAHIFDRARGRSVMSLANRLNTQADANIKPRLVFRCAETVCQLAEIWTLDAGYGLPVRHVREPEYIASIPLTVQRN
jgi:hypothetical protein